MFSTAFLVLAALQGPQPAQVAEVRERLEQQLELLRPRFEQLRVSMAVRDSVRASRAQLDSVGAGPVQFVFSGSDANLARDLIRRAWSAFEDPFAEVEFAEPDNIGLLIEEQIPTMGDIAAATEVAAWVRLQPWVERSEMVVTVERAIASRIATMLPASLRGWIGTSLRSAESDASELYRIMAVARTMVTQACLTGDLDACMSGLAIRRPASPWTAWYSEDQMVNMAREEFSNRWDDESDLNACTVSRIIQGCIAILGRPPNPVPYEARQDLVKIAIGLGGADGFEQVVSLPDEAGLEDALETLAGVEPREVVAIWHERMMRENVPVAQGLQGLRLAVLMWVVGLAYTASRSSRWVSS